MADLELAAVVEGLRQELTSAMDLGRQQQMQFQLDPIELTLQVEITNQGHGKIGWKVLEAGGSRQSVSTQTLVLRLTPVWKNPDGGLVRDFTIASVGSAAEKFGPQQ